MKKILLTTGVALSLPLITYAQLDNTQDLIYAIADIIESLITVVGASALLAFMWGLAKFIFKASDENAKEEGKNIMKWGLVALFVMMTVWGILRFFQEEFGLTDTSPLDVTNLI